MVIVTLRVALGVLSMAVGLATRFGKVTGAR